MRGKNAAAFLAVAATLLLLVPLVHGQGDPAKPKVTTPTSLYFHIFDIFNAFPINTQKPNTDYFEVGGTNFPTVVGPPESGQNYDFNTMYGYSTSGFVEYDFIENGQPRFHPERGIASDISIDGNAQHACGAATAPACVHIYVSLRDVIGGEFIPNYMPTYTFRFEMRELNVLGDTAALDAAPRIMYGELTQHLVSKEFKDLNGTADADGVKFVTPNADGIIEYAIPMTIEAMKIPKQEGYHVKIDWYQNPGSDPQNADKAAEGYMRLASQEGYNPRLDLSITNPIYIDFVHPEVAAGILLIHTAENSPWGTYDIDVKNITVEVKDSAGNVIDAPLQQVVSQNAHVHNLHNKSAEVTYLWRYRGDPDNGIPGAADGKYTITVGVQNLAKTATASTTAEFVLEGKKAYGIAQDGSTVSAIPDPDAEGESSPGAGLLVLVVLLGVALMARRRGT